MTGPTVAWVTGAHGFIGRHLCRHLARRGYRVAGLGHGSWSDRDAAEWGLSWWVQGDVAESNLTAMITASGPPGAIFHLAGGSAVGPSYTAPLEDFRRTVESTARLLSWVRDTVPASRIVAASSAAVFGAAHDGPIPPDAPLTPISPYGHHKAMMEMLCQEFANGFGLDVAVVRLFSVYGPGLRKQLLWDLCTRIASGENPVRLGGSGDELRDWIHVDDVVELLERVARQPRGDDLFRVNGGGTGATVRRVASLVCEAWGGGIEAAFTGERRPGDPPSLLADPATAAATGFEARVDLAEGIGSVVHWYRQDTGS
jgi:UDP-glucose 4-epimerase